MLEVEGLRAWASGQQRLRGVSFPLAEYDSLAMLGASGSGKSLTARGILGLPPRGVRYDGTVLFQGQNLLAMPAKQLSALHGKALSMIFQEPSTALNPVMRIGDQIAEPLTIHTKLSNQEQRRRVVELLDKTGLTAAGVGPKRFPHELSGGQRQRVAVAIALALSPALVIADEPTSALDAVSAAMVLDLLFELAAEVGTAVIIITHDIDVARRARQTLVLSEGNVAELGPTRSVLTAPKSEPAALLVAGAALTLPSRERQAGKMVLSAERITVARGGAHVVREASFAIRAGERLALVGRSGSGKTSLSRAIVGLLPMSGRVTLSGKPVVPTSPVLRRAVQMVFQDPVTSFNPRHNIGQIVTEPLFGTQMAKKERLARADTLLAQVGLPGVLERKPHEFSGGQRQRIAIARALVASPRVLIADEAVSALDAALRAEVIALLDELTRVEHIALVFIAHDLSLVRHLADRVLVMDAGRIVEAGATETVFARPQASETKALLAAGDRHQRGSNGALERGGHHYSVWS